MRKDKYTKNKFKVSTSKAFNPVPKKKLSSWKMKELNWNLEHWRLLRKQAFIWAYGSNPLNT